MSRNSTSIRSAVFVKSSFSIQQMPSPSYPEYAFAGRSNVGKSSLINMLVQQKRLAKTSSLPGKTRSINHFLINNNFYVADLPGYGFAQAAQRERKAWIELMEQYLTTRITLRCIFVLIDARLNPQPIDMEFISWLGEKHMPFAIILTKADKLKRQKLYQNKQLLEKTLSQTLNPLPPIMVTSAKTGEGRAELLEFIEANNKTY